MHDRRTFAYVMGDMDMIAPLGRAGIRCVSIAEPTFPTRRSRYVDHSIDELDTWNDPEAMARRLVAAAEAEDEPPVLFYQGDPDLLMVSRLRNQLAPALRFVIAGAELVEDLVDKSRFADLARRCDLDVPLTLVLEPGDSLPAVERLPYPLIVKPSLRRSDEWTPTAGSAKAIRVDDHRELERLWAQFGSAGTGIIVQELIDGPESGIESHHVYVDADGAIAGEFTGRKIRTRPLSYGISTAVEVVDLPDVRRLGREIVERVGLTGVAKLDFKRDASGRLRLLEINARFNLWHFPGALAGVNIPALVFADLTGTQRPEVRRVDSPVRWVKPWHDVLAAREAGIGAAGWARFVAGCSAKSAMSWRDPLAAAAALSYGLRTRERAGADHV